MICPSCQALIHCPACGGDLVAPPSDERLREVLRIAFAAMLEADAHFSETSEKCLGLAHALPKVREALSDNAVMTGPQAPSP